VGTLIGQNIFHYQILEKLGEGGMGVVYKARDTKLDRLVALKFLPTHLAASEQDKDRFMHEARAASALDHPNIGVVHEIDETDDGNAFICMAYYAGQTLKERLENGPLSDEKTIDVALQVADGLQRAHQEGIVHRDIKPANIILAENDTVKIVDFGLAKLSSDTRSRSSEPTSSHGGTAPYMSPEQIKGGPVDHRSDLFSLGIVLYEMLTGRLPFTGEHYAAIFYAISHLEPVPLSRYRQNIPAGFEQIVNRLLQKNPEERYQNAADLIADLERLKSGALVKTPVLTKSVFVKILHPPAKYLAVAIAVLAILAAALIWIPGPDPLFSLDPPAYVVVADVKNTTGKKFFDHSLTEAIKVSLRQSPHITLLPSDRIMDALRRMRIDENHRLDESTAIAAAQREGARVVIAGTIDPLGSGYIITCKIIDAVSGEIIKMPRHEIPGVEEVLDGLDKLCEDIRGSLGESIREISQNAMPLSKVTTASLEALELYSRGDRMEQQGKYEEAALLKGQAAEIDSLFAMAVSDLSYIHRKLGHDSLAIVYHKQVPALMDRVTDRERYEIMSTYYGPSFEFDFRKAYESARQMVLRYPNDTEALNELGHLAMYFCEINTAIEVNNRALDLDPSMGSVYNNSGYAAALAGNVEEALRYFRQSKKIRPTYYTIDTFIAHAQWVGGMSDSMEYTLRRIIPLSGLRRQILSQAQLATLFLTQGQLDRATSKCDSGLLLCRQGKTTVCEAYFYYLLGRIAFERGDDENFIKAMLQAEATARSPFTELAMIAVSYARAGFEQDALRLLERLKKTDCPDPYFVRQRDHFLHWINGEVYLSRHEQDLARQEFEAILKVHCGDPVFFSAQWGIARSYMSSDDSLAVRQLQTLIERPGELIMGPLMAYPSTGSWTGNIRPEAQLTLGKIYFRQDRLPQALRHLDAALQFWREADPEFKNARVAKSILAELQKQY